MCVVLRQSTAVTKKIGPFLDETDGKTAEIALTITQADVRLSKNGGAFAQKTEASASAHDESGYYGVALDTTDTGTLGSLRLHIAEAGALPVWQDFMVVTANVYDSMFSTDVLDVSLIQVLGTALTESAGAGKLAGALVKLLNVATPTGTVNSLPDAVAGAANGLLISGSNAGTTTLGALAVTGTTTLSGVVSAPAANSIAGTLAAVTALTNLPAAPGDWLNAAAVKADAVTKIQAGLATPTNITAASGVALAANQHVIVDSGSVTSVPAVVLANSAAHGGAATVITLATPIVSNSTQVEGGDATTALEAAAAVGAAAALVAMNLDHLMKTPVADRSDMTAEVADDTVLANLMAKAAGDTSDYDPSTDSLEAVRDKLPANLEDLNITDTTGLVRPDMANASGNYAGTVATTTTVTNAVTATGVSDVKGVTDKLDTAMEVDGPVYRFTTNALEQGASGGMTDESVADAVCNELIAEHVIVGSVGAALAAAGWSGDPWAAPLPGAYAEGQAGFILYMLLPIMGAYEGMVRMQTSGPGMNRGNMRKLLRLRLRGTPAESYIAEHFDRQLNLSAQEISLLLAQDRNAQVNYGRSSYSFITEADLDEYPLYGIADLHSPRDLYGGANSAGGRCITEKEKTLLLSQNPSGMDEDGRHLYWVKHVSDETYRLTITATAGTFTLTYNGSSVTAALAFDISAANLQTALEGLDGVGDGNVTVTEDDDGTYVITFSGDLSQVNMAEFEADPASLTGGTAILEQHHYSICYIKTPQSGQTFTFVYNLLVPEIPTGLAGDDLSYSVVPPIHYEAIVHHAAMILAGYSSSPQAQFALTMAAMTGQQAVDSGAKAITPFQVRT